MGRSEEKQQVGGQATASISNDRGYRARKRKHLWSRNVISKQIISSRTLLN
jgi:hypothetical protein